MHFFVEERNKEEGDGKEKGLEVPEYLHLVTKYGYYHFESRV